MLTAPSRFSAFATELEHLHLRRETVIHAAFDALLACCPGLAALLLEGLGDARRAAIWLSTRQRAFAGQTAWDLLAEGDEDTVWDAASRLVRLKEDGDHAAPSDRSRAA
jgi:hypothetical protein